MQWIVGMATIKLLYYFPATACLLYWICAVGRPPCWAPYVPPSWWIPRMEAINSILCKKKNKTNVLKKLKKNSSMSHIVVAEPRLKSGPDWSQSCCYNHQVSAVISSHRWRTKEKLWALRPVTHLARVRIWTMICVLLLRIRSCSNHRTISGSGNSGKEDVLSLPLLNASKYVLSI